MHPHVCCVLHREPIGRLSRLIWTLLSTTGAALSLLSMLVVSLTTRERFLRCCGYDILHDRAHGATVASLFLVNIPACRYSLAILLPPFVSADSVRCVGCHRPPMCTALTMQYASIVRVTLYDPRTGDDVQYRTLLRGARWR